MKRWNPYNIVVEDEWVKEFADNKRIPEWYARMCLNIGLFITCVEYFITGKIKERG